MVRIMLSAGVAEKNCSLSLITFCGMCRLVVYGLRDSYPVLHVSLFLVHLKNLALH